MKGILTKFQDFMVAITYAEAGEWDTAKKLIPESELSRELTWLDRIFTAAAFASAGLQQEAVRILDPPLGSCKRLDAFTAADLGLKGVRMLYGTVSI